MNSLYSRHILDIIASRAKPSEYVLAAYQIIMLLTIFFHYPVIAFAPLFITFHLVIIGILYWLIFVPNKFTKPIRLWSPVLIIPLNFSELHYLVQPVNPVDWDPALIQLDYQIFGVHPTVWLEGWSNPWLTEYFQIVYTSFYFLPIILALALLKRGDRNNFEYIVFVMVFGFYISYLGYFIVPALGPRFTLTHLQNEPLTGIWLTSGIRKTVNWLENIQRDAFPSGHTEITILTMAYAWKFSRLYFWILSVTGSSLIISTVYLRYHYVVDVFAGIWLALFVLFAAPSIYSSIIRIQESKQSI